MAASAAGFQSLHSQLAVADHARFFKSWLRRIAPDTANPPAATAAAGGWLDDFQMVTIKMAAIYPFKQTVYRGDFFCLFGGLTYINKHYARGSK